MRPRCPFCSHVTMYTVRTLRHQTLHLNSIQLGQTAQHSNSLICVPRLAAERRSDFFRADRLELGAVLLFENRDEPLCTNIGMVFTAPKHSFRQRISVFHSGQRRSSDSVDDAELQSTDTECQFV